MAAQRSRQTHQRASERVVGRCDMETVAERAETGVRLAMIVGGRAGAAGVSICEYEDGVGIVPRRMSAT